MSEQYKHTSHYSANDYERPKEIFKFLGNLVEMQTRGKPSCAILDVGCAKGEFLYYLKSRFAARCSRLAGVDFSQTLIEQARKFPGLAGVEFVLDDAASFSVSGPFDVITATGVISYFDDYAPFLDNLLAHLAGDGAIILTNGFTTSGMEVRLRFRRHDDADGEWLPGWNQHSIQGLEAFARRRGKTLDVHKFELPFPLEPQEDPLRSWTIQTPQGQLFVNGLNQVWDLWSLVIR